MNKLPRLSPHVGLSEGRILSGIFAQGRPLVYLNQNQPLKDKRSLTACGK